MKIFKKYCPESDKPAIKGLFESIYLEPQSNLTPARLLDIAAEEGERYGITAIIIPMLAKLDEISLRKLSNEIARFGRTDVWSVDGAKEIETGCDSLHDTFSWFAKSLRSQSVGMTPEDQSTLSGYIGRYEKVISTLANISESLKEPGAKDNPNTVRLANVKLRDTVAAANGIMKSLENRGILIQTDATQTGPQPIPSGNTALGTENHIPKSLPGKGHALRV